MTPWQRRLRLGLGVFTLLFAAGIGIVLVRRPPTNAPPPPPAIAPGARSTATKGVISLAEGPAGRAELRYDRAIEYPGGRTTFVPFRLTVPKREEREIRVSADEGEVTGEWPKVDVKLRNQVGVRTSDGMQFNTSEATYVHRDGLFNAPGPVTFSHPRVSGTARGMVYDHTREVVTLLDEVVLRVEPETAADTAAGDGATDITAGTGTLARRDRYIRLERAVRITRAGQTTAADTIIIYLSDDEQRIQLVELRGGASVLGTRAAVGGLKTMTARDMNLSYGPDGRSIQHATLMGAGTIELAGPDPAGGRRIGAELIDITLAPDGTTVTALEARGSVQVDTPAEAKTPARVIKAGALSATGRAGVGLTQALFTDQVDFRELTPGKSAPRVARSASMDLTLENGFTTIQSARFAGGVRFSEEDLEGHSHEARYQVASGSLALEGPIDRSARGPRVVEPRVTIEARGRIDLQLEAKTITAVDGVTSVLQPARESPARGARGARASEGRTPGLLKRDQPVFASADVLVYDSGTTRATYTGNALLWQGEASFKADALTLDDRSGNLSAQSTTGKVLTKMPLSQTNSRTKAKDTIVSLLEGQTMVYDDAERRAVYTGGASMKSPQGRVEGDRIEIYLKEEGGEVERLEGFAPVTVTWEDGVKAVGSRLTYFGAEDRYVMAGAPVRINEECRETTGKSLIYFRSTGRIIVDGNEERRTETRPEGCAPDRRK